MQWNSIGSSTRRMLFTTKPDRRKDKVSRGLQPRPGAEQEGQRSESRITTTRTSELSSQGYQPPVERFLPHRCPECRRIPQPSKLKAEAAPLEHQDSQPSAQGSQRCRSLDTANGYAPPEIRHVDGDQGTSFNLVDSKDEDVRRQMDIFVHLRPDKVLTLHIDNIRSWRTDRWAALAPTPIARQMLIGLEYGPGMNKIDPTAYTTKYNSDFDVALGGFLARNVSSHLRDVVITKVFREGEERGTVIFDHLADEIQSLSSLQRQKLLAEYVRTRQNPTETVKQFAARFRKLCEQMDDLDVREPKTEDDESLDLLTKLLPRSEHDVHRLHSIVDSEPKGQRSITSSLQSTIIWMERVEEQELE
ncbi:hypothetical protein CF327_g7532 [Tilletia walkeri]|nr:hypothetical protein CF327_g7532 [Tilletia walkeri]